MLYLDGKMNQAEQEFLKALELNPYEPMVHNNLGLIYMNRSEWFSAEMEYKKEIAINPRYDNVYMNLGVLSYQRGKIPLAIWAWEKAAKINPKNIDAYQSLAAVYYNMKNYKEAAYYFRQLESMGIPLPYNLPQDLLPYL